MKDRVINLGKALVHELGLEPGVDTLSRWMAHYVAEQIAISEFAKGDEKSKAEQRCFETVFKLWERRSLLPDGRRPFENFEPIFRALDSLDPESPRPFYYAQPPVDSSGTKDASKSIDDDVQKWIDIALGVDRAARILINFAFKQAAIYAKDKKTKLWIEKAANLKMSDDISVIIRLISDYEGGQDEKARERLLEDLKNDLKSKIEKLDTFSNFSSSLRVVLVNELEKISTGGSSSNIRTGVKKEISKIKIKKEV